MKKKTRVIFIVFCAVGFWGLLCILRLSFSSIDYERVLSGKRPRFAVESGRYTDGGTVEYQGFGYRLTSLCQFHVKDKKPVGYDRGPILRYQLNWIFGPLEDREDIRFEAREF